jgi:LmbE family N-acetylglucosaminyl deacetylase
MPDPRPDDPRTGDPRTGDPRTEVTLALSQWQQLHLRHLAHRRIVSTPFAERVVVLIPHPDDEVLGLGGTLLRLRGQAQVELVYLTDGRIGAGDRSVEEQMAATRAAEAKEIAARLGVSSPVLVGCNEHTFADASNEPMLVARIAEVLQRVRPDVVFAPFLWEAHGDHRYVNHLLAAAMRTTGLQPIVAGYEVWSMAPPGWCLDIGAQLPEKLELMRCYRSQMALFDYVAMAWTRAVLHAPLIPGASGVEVFWPCRGDKFVELVAGLDLASPAAQRTIALLTVPDTMP